MKIFANNFALILRLPEQHPHFQFQRIRWEAAEKRLLDAAEVDGQSLFVEAEAGTAFIGRVFALHTHAQIAEKAAELNIVFASEAERAAFYAAYAARFHAVKAAGGLVIGPGDSLLMMVRDGKWDLPKGKVEKGEEIERAAWREVEEETGLQKHRLTSKAAETWHIYNRRGRWDFKTTHWFWMETDSLEALKPQTAEGITELRWVPLSALRKDIPKTYPQIMDLARLAAFRGA